MTRLAFLIGLASCLSASAQDAPTPAAHWPQFRGPNASGVADGAKLPVEFGPVKNLLWKTPLPVGHSSPCIWGDRIFVTAFDKPTSKLETLCLDRTNGKILWRRTAPAEKIEKVHTVGSPAAATPTTDGERVYVYFGSYGLLCYSFAGEEAWKKPLPLPSTVQGTGSSPVLAGELLLLHREFNPEPCLMAVDRKSGAMVWKTPVLLASMGGPPDGYATPLVWRRDGNEEAVILSPMQVTAFALKDGKRRWSLATTASACATPTLGDGMLFVVGHINGANQGEADPLPKFDELLKRADKDGDGLVSKEEFPDDLDLFRRPEASVKGTALKAKYVFGHLDKEQDGKLTKQEWQGFVAMWQASQTLRQDGLLAIKPSDQGKVDKSSVQWREKQALPEVPSPLHYQGRLYLVKDGGIVSCLEPKTGKALYRGRLGAAGTYFASPVAGDGKIYCTSLEGTVVVLAAGDELKVLAKNKLGETTAATPALVDGKIYVRTEGHLYAFGE